MGIDQQLFFTVKAHIKLQHTMQSNTSGAGLSNVGHGAIYEAGDQRNVPQSEINERERYEEGQHRSHKNIPRMTAPSPTSSLPNRRSLIRPRHRVRAMILKLN